jgi:hypothetical protein
MEQKEMIKLLKKHGASKHLVIVLFDDRQIESL